MNTNDLLEKMIKHKDDLLKKYYIEMTTENNDGWTKNHFQKLFEERYRELEKIANKRF